MSDDELIKLAAFHGSDLVKKRLIANQVVAALILAEQKHNAMRGHHEGYAVLLEEVDELWSAIKENDYNQASREALHVAAMAMRYLQDVVPRRHTT